MIAQDRDRNLCPVLAEERGHHLKCVITASVHVLQHLLRLRRWDAAEGGLDLRPQGLFDGLHHLHDLLLFL
jgi:hypothetical protein